MGANDEHVAASQSATKSENAMEPEQESQRVEKKKGASDEQQAMTKKILVGQSHQQFKKLQDFFDVLHGYMSSVGQFLSRIFTSPLVNDAIYFDLPEHELARVTAIGCSYDKATKNLIDGIFESRKDKIKGKDGYVWIGQVNLKDFPGWDDSAIAQLRNEFRTFDRSNTGVITFEDMTQTLDKIGNKSTEEERRKHFKVIDTDKSGYIDFNEFCAMVYNLNTSEEEAFPDVLYDLYKSLDRDMMSVPNFTVLQQLQSGLF